MKKILLFLSLFACAFYVQAQVTTASLRGTVKENSGEVLEGATVKATHVPTGTVYGGVAQENGRYIISNMRIGGPYTIEATYIGYEMPPMSNVYLALGERLAVDLLMQTDAGSLGEVVIEIDPILNSERTGAATSVNRQTIENLPTISRSADDYTRLNPMSAEGGSFAGRNDQFNSYSLNGTIFNNPFGLDAATPGGQTAAQPISLDAIEQINISIAPYDVTQSGFTGAAINAVTKSGTNEFHGTGYGFFRNSSMIGDKVGDTEVFTGDLSSLQAGLSLGGPIKKNKAFFFVNFEMEQRSDLGSYFLPNTGSGAANESRVLKSDMQFVADLLSNNYGYDVGALENFKHDADNMKGIVKLDFNLNKNHTLSASYNFLDAFQDKPAHPSAIGRRGPDFQTLQFQNSGYRINNKIHSGIVELKSVFGSKFANKLQAGMTAFRDSRDPFSSPFPVLNISKDGARYIIAGHEPFSINNVLDQDAFQIRNDFNIYSGRHNYTIGSSFERFNFNNSFNLTGYGARVFFPAVDISGVEALVTSADFAAEVQGAKDAFAANNAGNSWALAETNLGQWSIYGQDEYQATDRFIMTVGLRADVPLYFNTPELIQKNIDSKGGLVSDGGTYAPDVVYYDENANPIQFDHTKLPRSTPLINPRFGFNWDIMGDRREQLRGGTGVFTGRFPFVWVGNQVANPDFFFYNMTDPNFKYPQVWRTNLGWDHTLGHGWVISADAVYTRDLQAQMVRNYGLKMPTGRLGGVDNRPIYLDGDRAQGPFGGATNAYVFTNAPSGESTNFSLQIERGWNNFYAKLGYNYLNAKDVASIDAEISSDAYDRNPANVLNTNQAELAPSLYGNRHRVMGAASKKFSYGGRFATTLSMFFQYAQGGRYSYTYNGDINNDGSGLNDLLFIPTDAQIDAMTFAGDDNAQQAQRAGFKSYIAQDDYLSGRRGQYAEKYGALSPWYNNWDFRLLQDIGTVKDQRFQISLDILNIGNLINSAWGVRQFATQTALAQPIAVSVDAGAPTYSFDVAQKQTFFDDFSLRSRWQAQVGLRYIF